MEIYQFLFQTYSMEAVAALIIVLVNRSAARKPPPPWAPPGYQRPRMRKGLRVTLIVSGIVGPFVLLAGWFAVFIGGMWMVCRGGGSC